MKFTRLQIPREEFTPDNVKYKAYDDCALPIGGGQTISQPYMVAVMTELLELSHEHKVLEIGTGSGYQAAVLGSLARKVYTIERIAELTLKAKKVLDKRSLLYSNPPA